MPSAHSAIPDWPRLKDEILTLADNSVWTPTERSLVKRFVGSLVSNDLGEFVFRYLELVKSLAAPTGMDGAIVLNESGHLIAHLDPRAYDGVPVGVLHDPVEFVQRRAGNARIRQRFKSWAWDIPLRLHAIKAQIIQTPSATVFDFPKALLEIMQTAAKSKPVPDGLKSVCEAIRLGKTSITRVDPPGLVAFYWPISGDDFADLLTAKEAVAFLGRVLPEPIKGRTLFDRAKIRPSLKQGSKYVKEELRKAATEGVFKRDWKAP